MGCQHTIPCPTACSSRGYVKFIGIIDEKDPLDRQWITRITFTDTKESIRYP